MKRLRVLLVAVLSTGLLLPACTAPPDLLSTIVARGTLVVSTDFSYPPQSALKQNPQPTAGSKCTSDQKTVGELEGFAIDTAAAIAKAMAVEPCFVAPMWEQVIAGGWAGKWDVSVGSMTITTGRTKVLLFAQPYSTTPASLFVFGTNAVYSMPSDLNGKKIGVIGG